MEHEKSVGNFAQYCIVISMDLVIRLGGSTYIDTGGLPLDNRSLKKDILIDEPKVVVQLGHSSGEDPLAGGLLLLLLLTLLALLALLLL